MSKALRKNYVCQACGAVYSKWQGQCTDCNEWSTIVEEAPKEMIPKGITKISGRKIEFTESNDFSNLETQRYQTGISELDRVLGGGLVQGSAILIGGDPGIGKSTILLQLAANLSRSGKSVAYISGEESATQIKLRAKRLGLGDAGISLASATNVGDIISSLESVNCDALIIDSVQTMYIENIDSAPGTVGQVRSSSFEIIRFAKKRGIVVFFVGHVTKDGQIAGPKVLEHMVDTVLYFEGERGHNFRILRAVKNRYGGTDEIGVFEMGSAGLNEVTNPSALFLPHTGQNVTGSAVFAGIEGTRPLLVEVQALVADSYMASPRRAVVGWDTNRLSMILAVLDARAGIKLGDKEVYLNIAGGLRISEPAADLSVAAALVSSLSDKPLPAKSIFFGEVGLSGEVRLVSQIDLRLKEAQKLGFETAFIPKGAKVKQSGIQVVEIGLIRDLRDIL